jgi:hypothetical protein
MALRKVIELLPDEGMVTHTGAGVDPDHMQRCVQGMLQRFDVE